MRSVTFKPEKSLSTAHQYFLKNNRPLPSPENSHFQNDAIQNDAKCTAFLVKMSFICMRMKNHFRIKG